MTQQQNQPIDHKLLRKYSVIAPNPADFSFPESYPELLNRIEMNNQDYPSLFGTGFSKLSPLQQCLESEQMKIAMESTGFSKETLEQFICIAFTRMISIKEDYHHHDLKAVRFSLYEKGHLKKCFETTLTQAYRFMHQLGITVTII